MYQLTLYINKKTVKTIYMYRMLNILRMYTQQGVLVFLGFVFYFFSINGKFRRERERERTQVFF